MERVLSAIWKPEAVARLEAKNRSRRQLGQASAPSRLEGGGGAAAQAAEPSAATSAAEAVEQVAALTLPGFLIKQWANVAQLIASCAALAEHDAPKRKRK